MPRRRKSLTAGLRLLLALAALAAGQSTAARAEPAAPRSTVERVVRAPSAPELHASAGPRSARAPLPSFAGPTHAQLALPAPRASAAPLFLLHRALLR